MTRRMQWSQRLSLLLFPSADCLTEENYRCSIARAEGSMPRILPFGRNSRWYEALLLCGLYHYCFMCLALLVDAMEYYWSA